MKRFLVLLLALALVFGLVACDTQDGTTPGDDTTDGTNDTTDTAKKDDSTEPSDNTTEPPVSDVVYTTYTVKLDNGLSIEVGGDASWVSAEDAIDYMEAPNCIYEGFDKVYTFDGYSINTSPDKNGGEYITELAILSDMVAFESGLTIGSDLSAVDAEFGDNFTEQFGVRTYKLGEITTVVILDGSGIVTGITLSANRS